VTEENAQCFRDGEDELPVREVEEELLTEQEDVVKTPFDKIRVQRNSNFDPERVGRFVHDLRSQVELGDLRAIYDDTRELVPEMQGPTYEEMMAHLRAG
jgi:FlaA1/EpsC-like NDP-sugar epimerase